MTTLAPAPAKARAQAAPIPVAEPVTMTVLPEKSSAFIESLVMRGF